MEALLGIVLGASLAGLFALVGAHFKAATDQTAWRRDERTRAYVDFLAAVDSLILVVHTKGRPTVETLSGGLDRVLQTKARVTLIGPLDVVAAADQLAGVWRPDMEITRARTMRETFIASAKQALDADRAVTGGSVWRSVVKRTRLGR